MGLSIWIVCCFLRKEIMKKIKEKNEFLFKLIVDEVGGFRVMMIEV
jgi:hypothetical protein